MGECGVVGVYKASQGGALLDYAGKHREEFVELMVNRVVEGDDPREIAKSFGVRWGVLKKVLEEVCSEEMGLACRARADLLMHEAEGVARGASVEEVAVARLRVETLMKLAGKMDRSKWGEKAESGGGGVTVVIDATCGGSVEIKA